MTFRQTLLTSIGALAFAAAPAMAQTATQQTGEDAAQTTQQTAATSQCLESLRALNERMQQDGFWLTGWGTRWGTEPPMAAAPEPEVVAPDGQAVPPRAAITQGPWGVETRHGVDSPRYQIRVLYSAASVLAHRGDEEACHSVTRELGELYASHVEELRQAGVEPGEVTSWRQERIVEARPVSELGTSVSMDDITGTEVRNARDERLGSIHDVVADPQSGQITHLIVARGGFLGLGAEYAVVPWEAFGVASDLNLFVLNVTEEAMQQAPTVESDQIGDHAAFDSQRRLADEYWQNHTQQ